MKRFWFNCGLGIRIFKTSQVILLLSQCSACLSPMYAYPSSPHAAIIVRLIVLRPWAEKGDKGSKHLTQEAEAMPSVQTAEGTLSQHLSKPRHSDAPHRASGFTLTWGNSTLQLAYHLSGNTSNLLCLRLPCPSFGKGVFKVAPWMFPLHTAYQVPNTETSVLLTETMPLAQPSLFSAM